MVKQDLMNQFRTYKYNEQKLLETVPYLEINEDNKNSYSLNFCILLQNICTDFESLIKMYFGISDDEKNSNAIERLKNDDAFSEMLEEEVSLINYKYHTIHPFITNYDEKKKRNEFVTWIKYNKIKHNKIINIKQANQETVISALAALFCLNMYILKQFCEDEDVDFFPDYYPIFKLGKLKQNYEPIKNLAVPIKNRMNIHY